MAGIEHLPHAFITNNPILPALLLAVAKQGSVDPLTVYSAG